MNWEAIGAVAESLGAIGIIVTLIYLSTQLRQTNKALASATRNSWRDAVQVTNQINISSPENADVWYRAINLGETLEGKDFGIFQVQASAGLNAFENVYLEYLDGNIEESFWLSKARTVEYLLARPAGKAVWDIWAEAGIADPRFEAFVSGEIIPRIESNKMG